MERSKVAPHETIQWSHPTKGVFNRIHSDNLNHKIANARRLRRAIDRIRKRFDIAETSDLGPDDKKGTKGNGASGVIYAIYSKWRHDKRLYVGETTQTVFQRFQCNAN